VSPSALTAGSVASTVVVQVSVATTCGWSAAVDREWVSLTAGATGTGAGSITLQLTANTSTEERTATLRLASLTEIVHAITIRQAGAVAACTWSLVPTRADVGSRDGDGTFQIQTGSTCSWTVSPSVDWIRVTSAPQGIGPAVVSWSVVRNDDVAPRSGAIRVADQVFRIDQAGSAEACVYAVAPVLFTPCMARRTFTADVVTSDACAWTVTTDQSWISVSGNASRTSSGTITFDVDDNWAPPRTGVVMVRWPTATAGQNLHIQQAGCTYVVSPTSAAIAGAGGITQVAVFQQSDPYTCGGPLQDGCLWSATTDTPWLRITTPMPRMGDGTFTVAADPNTTGQPRTGVIRVADRAVVITQTAGPATSRR
jgi:hypothetical protein